MKSNSPFKTPDPPGSKEKPGIFDKIRNIATESAKHLIPGYTMASTVGKAGLNFAKDQLVKNINPYGYESTTWSDGDPNQRGPGERVLRALVSKEEQQGDWQGQATMERKDLFGMMLGRQQKYNSIPLSKYRPTSSKDQEAIYYSSPTSEKTITEKLKNPEFLKSFKPNKQGVMSLHDYVTNVERGTGDNVLGNYTLNQGEDDKGKYVSYYDKWDLEPYKGRGAHGNNKILHNISTKAQKLAGVKPTEVYGRVYY
jgi:hypothetical protein